MFGERHSWPMEGREEVDVVDIVEGSRDGNRHDSREVTGNEKVVGVAVVVK